MGLRDRVERFVEEKFPKGHLERWLIVLAIVIGPVIYVANWYVTARLWWDLVR